MTPIIYFEEANATAVLTEEANAGVDVVLVDTSFTWVPSSSDSATPWFGG
jgi:hypothetical protein